MEKHENNVRVLWDNIKQANIYIIGILETEEKEKDWKYIWRNYVWKLSNLKETDTKIYRKHGRPQTS